ncbi:MAG: hypothetical protein KF734_11815 [Saprospiraceae bacterium]|nr:hypothetical protein [Saprospiraceae bacterium]
MKKSIFAPPPRTTLALTVAALLLLNIVVSCHREQAERQMPAPPSDVQVTERATCTDPDLCNLSVTASSDADLTLCGSFPPGIGTLPGCITGCDPFNDKELSGMFLANVPRERCIDIPGSVCITNNGSSTVTVTVQFGTSTAMQVNIPPSGTHCFHTTDCSDTNDGCL